MQTDESNDGSLDPTRGSSEGSKSDPTEVDVLLSLSPDQMTLSLNASFTEDDTEAVAEQIALQLSNLGINEEEHRKNAHQHFLEEFDRVWQQAEKETSSPSETLHIMDYILLKGLHPEPPVDATLVWARDFFNRDFVVNSSTGIMDYRQRLGNLSVSEGELLLSISPLIEGKPGRDLLGKIIPPPKAKMVHVRTGANVFFDKETLEYFAKKDGRIRFQEDGTILVDDVFTIQGDVGLKTGHVKHPGVLVVSGNIDPGSIVETTGDIEVNGYIEDADIWCGGNLIVHGAIYGTENTTIKIREGLRAKFLKNAHIEAQGEITIQGSIEQCQITTQTTVNVSNGRIVGGQVTALQGIEADQFGSDACVKTELLAGLDFSYQTEIALRTEEIAVNQEKLQTVLNTLLHYKERSQNMPDLLKRKMGQLTGEVRELQQSIQETRTLIAGLEKEASAQEVVEIVVRKEAFPECVFHINGMTHRVKQYLTGPAYLAVAKEGITITGSSVRDKKKETDAEASR